MEDNDNEQEGNVYPKSKSQLKREMTALQELGGRLINLSINQLTKLQLPQALHAAILEAKKINSHSASRRQLQYIGRLMRDIEQPELIQAFLDDLTRKNNEVAAYNHMLEAWRDKLVLTVDAMTEFLALFPNADRQRLRQLVQNAKKEQAFGKPLGARKQLFRYIRELHQQKQSGGNGD